MHGDMVVHSAAQYQMMSGRKERRTELRGEIVKALLA